MFLIPKVYEDSSLFIFNKPQGLATTPGKKNSLCEFIFKEYPELKKVQGYKKNEGGLLNRLDNETGGLVFVARTNESFEFYKNLMSSMRVEKYYIACVDKKVKDDNGIITIPIAHHKTDKKRMVVVENNISYRGRPQEAESVWKKLDEKKDITVLEVIIKKGVRHQIRLHLSCSEMPIVSDKLYNKKKNSKFKNHLLYAYKVKFKNFGGIETEVKVNVPFLELI